VGVSCLDTEHYPSKVIHVGERSIQAPVMNLIHVVRQKQRELRAARPHHTSSVAGVFVVSHQSVRPSG
jgi:hypothetical protein